MGRNMVKEHSFGMMVRKGVGELRYGEPGTP